MTFIISNLPAEDFAALSQMTETELEARNILQMCADTSFGYPCRVSLEDAKQGEIVYLLNYVHQDTQGPFRASHAIYIRENAKPANLTAGEIPIAMKNRILSVRGFDRDHLMVAAELVDGKELAPLIESFWKNKDVAYLHIHYAKPGCFAARVNRV
jgi:hypothetical protein